MNHLPFNPSDAHYLPFISLAIVGFCGYARKVVKAVSNFAIFVFQESGRAVREYHKVVGGVRQAHGVKHNTDTLDLFGYEDA